MDKEVLVSGNKYKATFIRFDEDINPDEGASYHGYDVKVSGDNLRFRIRKYDNDDEVGLFFGDNQDINLIETISRLIFAPTEISFRYFKYPAKDKSYYWG